MILAVIGIVLLALLAFLALFLWPQLANLRKEPTLTVGADTGERPSATASATPRTASASPSRTRTAKKDGRKGGPSGQRPSSSKPKQRKLPPPSGTQCGAAFLPEGDQTSTSALAAADRRFGRLDLVRVYYTVPSPWPGRAGTPGRPVVVSFKLNPRQVNTGRYDAALSTWFRTAPRDRDIYWALHHEPEDNIEDGEFTAAEFRQAWRRVAGLATPAGNPRMRATLILMDWSLERLSGRQWRDYYPGGDVVDVLAFDVYNDGWKDEPQTYHSAKRELATVVTTARALGKPWGLAELGSNQMDNDPSGAGRVAWIRDVISYAIEHEALFVSYFDIDYAEHLDYRLRDRPAINAWRDFCDR